MSALANRTQTLYINANNDAFDTLIPILHTLPNGRVPDNKDNRLNAALACIYSVAMELRETKNKIDELEQRLGKLGK